MADSDKMLAFQSTLGIIKSELTRVINFNALDIMNRG
jgi:hypothetical protein